MKTTLFYFFTFTFLIVFSQKSIKGDYSFEISEPYKINDTKNREYFSKGDEILAVKYHKNKVFLQKYNSATLEFVSVKEYNDFDGNIVVESLLEVNSTYFLFYSLWSKKNSYGELYYRIIDFDKGEFTGEKTKVLSIKEDTKTYNSIRYKDSGTKRNSLWLTYSKDNSKQFSFFKSEDETKIAISYIEKPKVKSDKKSFDITNFSVFSNKMKLLWNKTYTMPYTERIMDLLSTTLTSEGDIFYLARVFHDESNQDFVDNKPNYHLELFKLSETNEEKVNSIDFGAHFLSDVVIFEQDSTINCLGFYNSYISNSDTWNKRHAGKKLIKGNANGIFYIKTDKISNKVIFDKKKEIPIEVITKHLGKGGEKRMKSRDKKGKAEFFDLKLRNVVFLEKGEVFILGEQLYFFEVGGSYFNVSQGEVGGHYSSGKLEIYAKDFLIAKLDSLGDIKLINRLAKKHKKADADKTFTYFKIKDKHYIAFLDNIKNLNLTEKDIPERYDDGGGRKGCLMVYEINNKTGEVKKDAIFDLKNITDEISGHLFDVNRIMKTKDDALLLELYKKDKEEILIKIQRN